MRFSTAASLLRKVVFTAVFSAASLLAACSVQADPWDHITDPAVLEILDRVTFAWPEGPVAYIDVSVTDKNGKKIAAGEVQMTHDVRVFEYLEPHRYRDDFLFMDGELLHVDFKTGREGVRPVVHRDLRDRVFFWLGVVAFHELEESHDVKSFKVNDDGSSTLILEEVADHIRFDRVEVTAPKDPEAPLEVRVHDLEEAEYWDLTYYPGHKVTVAGETFPFPARIDVYPEREGEHYTLTIEGIEVGKPSYLHRGAHHGFE